MKRADNFNAGLAALPLPVLERIQAELPDYGGTGMSVMEFSHRSAEYEAIHNDAQMRLRRLLGIPDGYQVLFLQGGASLQFAMLPMNFLKPADKALYVLTGTWSQKAADEASRYGELIVDDWAKQGGIGISLSPSLGMIHPYATFTSRRITPFTVRSGDRCQKRRLLSLRICRATFSRGLFKLRNLP
ncbi:hypothetical protein GCM10025858_32360 [Alicyclobacillus sacchari]|nr:hypothetical protein GCM10025858_32360 [Alicyclobacillus sacchari]